VNIVLLTTARGARPSTVATLRDQLGVTGRDDITLGVVSLHVPRRPLPVATTLVVGPDPTVRRHARELPPAPPGADPTADDDDVTWEDAATAEAEAGAPVSPRPIGGNLARVRHGLKWRVGRVRLAVRAHPAARRVRQSTKVRRLRHAVTPGGPGTKYAVAALRARNVGDLVAAADVVVALDTNTHKAAWLLARRHQRPAVVVGAPAGKAVIDRLSRP
jgi:hypothetical protein